MLQVLQIVKKHQKNIKYLVIGRQLTYVQICLGIKHLRNSQRTALRQNQALMGSHKGNNKAKQLGRFSLSPRSQTDFSVMNNKDWDLCIKVNDCL